MNSSETTSNQQDRSAVRATSAVPRRARRQSRGTTVTEVLMAISVLAIGASGIFALQKATTVANRDAKNLEVANQIARTWLDRLRSDGMKWNYPSPGNTIEDLANDTTWFTPLSSTTALSTGWYRPSNAKLKIYGEHDAFGNDNATETDKGPYCVNLRLGWLGKDKNLIRAEVRVYWLRQGVQAYGAKLSLNPPPEKLCDLALISGDVDTHGDVFHVVHAVTGIFKNMPR